MNLIELNLSRIAELCRKHKVKTLSVFGSILTEKFNEESDVDLLVNFQTFDHEREDYVSNYFGFRDSLEKLFHRRVDLIEEQGLQNKFFLDVLNRTKRTIYG